MARPAASKPLSPNMQPPVEAENKVKGLQAICLDDSDDEEEEGEIKETNVAAVDDGVIDAANNEPLSIVEAGQVSTASQSSNNKRKMKLAFGNNNGPIENHGTIRADGALEYDLTNDNKDEESKKKRAKNGSAFSSEATSPVQLLLNIASMGAPNTSWNRGYRLKRPPPTSLEGSSNNMADSDGVAKLNGDHASRPEPTNNAAVERTEGDCQAGPASLPTEKKRRKRKRRQSLYFRCGVIMIAIGDKTFSNHNTTVVYKQDSKGKGRTLHLHCNDDEGTYKEFKISLEDESVLEMKYCYIDPPENPPVIMQIEADEGAHMNMLAMQVAPGLENGLPMLSDSSASTDGSVLTTVTRQQVFIKFRQQRLFKKLLQLLKKKQSALKLSELRPLEVKESYGALLLEASKRELKQKQEKKLAEQEKKRLKKHEEAIVAAAGNKEDNDSAVATTKRRIHSSEHHAMFARQLCASFLQPDEDLICLPLDASTNVSTVAIPPQVSEESGQSSPNSGVNDDLRASEVQENVVVPNVVLPGMGSFGPESLGPATAVVRQESLEDDGDSSEDGYWASISDEQQKKKNHHDTSELSSDTQQELLNQKDASLDQGHKESPTRVVLTSPQQEVSSEKQDAAMDETRMESPQAVSDEKDGTTEAPTDDAREKSQSRIELEVRVPVNGLSDLSADDSQAESPQAVKGDTTEDARKERQSRMEAGLWLPTNGRPSNLATDGLEGVSDEKSTSTSDAQANSPANYHSDSTKTNTAVANSNAESEVIEEEEESEEEEDVGIASKKRPRSSDASSKSTTSGLEVSKQDTDPEVGDRVSVRFPNKKWYFGSISAVKRKKHSHHKRFSIEFDDGDKRTNVPRRDVRTANEADQIERDRDPEVGDRVYAKFTNNQWYWGEISAITRKKRSHRDHFSIIFDDGDDLSDVPRLDIRTVNEYRQDWYSGRQTLSPLEMHGIRCNRCELCTKPDCGHCASCRNNKSASPDDEHEVCLQKMCVIIPETQKKQPAEGLPPNWTFVFSRDKRYGRKGQRAYVPGLFIFHPDCDVAFRSVEAAVVYVPKLKAQNPKVVSEFNRHIGIVKSKGDGKEAGIKSIMRSSRRNAEADLGQAACGECENCAKQACRKCAACKSSTSGMSEHCFQKMCLRLPVHSKAMPAVGLPPGWRFYFDEHHEKAGQSYVYEPVPGLYLFTAGSKNFCSVAAVAGYLGMDDDREMAREFYTHAGLYGQLPESDQSQRNVGVSDPLVEYSPASKPAKYGTSFSNYRKVGSRVFCREGKEGRWGIITKKSGSKFKEYIFTVRLEDDNSLIEDLEGDLVLSEFHYKRQTGMDPPPPPGFSEAMSEYDSDHTVEEEPRQKKRKDDSPAAVKMITSTDHFLVGKKFCLAWIDLKNQKKVVYGRVVECKKNVKTGDIRNFKVAYSGRSREIVSAISNGCGSSVEESQMLPPSLVIGGCIQYAQLKPAHSSSLLDNVTSRNLHSWNWITPDLRHEDLVGNEDGQCLPRLTIAVQGFKLELNVKQSTIPNAGNGVFLTCKPLMMGGDDDEPMERLELKPGELIDLGVYAPLCVADRKLETVFFAKNFVHSHKCEEYSFDAGHSRYQLDITDDVTGDIHSEAKKHIHAYVNESDVHQAVCIHAEHDPESSVHYLLGHAHKSQGNCVLPADGTEREVFTNYGEDYEKNRVRKGYGFDPDRKEHLLKVIGEDDITDVKEMNRFGAPDVVACVDFLLDLLLNEADFKQEMIQRVLVCAAVLQSRARNIFLQGNCGDANGDDSTTLNFDELRVVSSRSQQLVGLLLNKIGQNEEMDELKVLQANGNVDRVRALVLRMQFQDQLSKRELSKLLDEMEE